MIKWELAGDDTIGVVCIKFNALRDKLAKVGHQVGSIGFNPLWNGEVNYASKYEGKNPIDSFVFDYAKIESVKYKLKNIDTVIVLPFRVGNKTVFFGMVKIGLRWEGHGEYYMDTDYDKKDAIALYLRVLSILRTLSGMFNIKVEDTSKWAEHNSIKELYEFAEKEIKSSNIVGTVIADALKSEGGSDE